MISVHPDKFQTIILCNLRNDIKDGRANRATRAISLRRRQNVKANRATKAIRGIKVYKKADLRLTQLPRQENLPSCGNDEGATRDKISKLSGLTWPPEPSNYIVIVGQHQIFDINLNIIQLNCMSAS